MPPQQFFIQLQHGIAGGFAPPTPSAVHTLSRSSDAPDQIVISSAIRQDGQPTLSAAAAPKKISIASSEALIDELHSILKTLPTESPPGSEDIYGLDTSISWGSDDLEWHNGGPSGCGGGNSEVKATDEQKQKFRRAVEIVSQLIAKEA